MNTRGFTCLAIIFLMAFTSSCTTVQQGKEGSAEQTATEDPVGRAHKKISQTLKEVASRLDKFFGDPRYEEEDNQSRMTISAAASWVRHEGLKLSPKVRLRLSLPELERRLQLIISGDGEEDEIADTASALEDETRRSQATNEKNTGVAIRYNVLQKNHENFSLKGGVRIRQSQLVGYLEPRYRRSWDFDDWQTRLIARTGWFSNSGLQANMQMDFETKWKEKFLFRATPGLAWFDEKNDYFYQLNFLLHRPIDVRRSLFGQWTNNFRAHSGHELESLGLHMRYRRYVWQDAGYLDFGIGTRFRNANNYDLEPTAVIRVGFVFGPAK